MQLRSGGENRVRQRKPVCAAEFPGRFRNASVKWKHHKLVQKTVDAADFILRKVAQRKHFGNRDDGNKERLGLRLTGKQKRNRGRFGFKTSNEGIRVKQHASRGAQECADAFPACSTLASSREFLCEPPLLVL